ncbi:MAG: glutamate racemase [Leeuwenhoekiella sp.]
MSNDHPIGLFDSGVGGTSIWKEIVKLLPGEHTVYLADSLNAPYGEKSKTEIIALCEKNTEWLLNKNCKLIVVACNTATTNAIDHLRAKYKVSFIGIEPAIKPAALQSRTKIIGVLATKGTLTSALFHRTANLFAPNIEVIEVIGTGLVEFIEQGNINGPELKAYLLKLLSPLLGRGIDHLVLGCSHYPYLLPILKELLPANVEIIDSGFAVARQTENVLAQSQLLNTGASIARHLLLTNKKEVCNVLANLLDPISGNTQITHTKF